MEMVRYKIFILALLGMVLVQSVSAQYPNHWNLLLTEHLISHNRHNYDDHKKTEKNQLKSQATVKLWENVTAKYKELSDKIDKRLTSVYIITSDAWMAYRIYQITQDIYNYEKKSMNIAYKYPFTIPTLIKSQKAIYQQAKDLALFASMVAASFTDVSKMTAANRKLIYNEVEKKLYKLKFKSFEMYTTLQMIQANQELQNAAVPGMVNRDKQKVNEILKSFDF